MKIYGIIDKRLPGVTSTFVSPSDAYAMRSVQMGLKEDNPMYNFPEDYKLVSIADLNEQTAEVTQSLYDVVEFAALVSKE